MAILIAESGSTKTDWRLIDAQGKINQYKTIGFNPYFQDSDSIFNEISTSLLPLIDIDVQEIYYYGTGVTNLEKADIVHFALKNAFKNAKIDICDDMLAAARSLCLNEPGIACILGTGSNTCYYDGNKIAFQIPALGFWLGDEGSGGYLGKELVKKYLRKELSAELEQKFIKRYGALERTVVLEKVYKEPFPNRYFASFSKFLFDNRANPEVYLIILDAFSLFFEKTVLKYPNYSSLKVHFTGSIAFYYSDILRKAATIAKLNIGVILESPIAGLVLYHKNIAKL
jgi:glucosamine kinase